MITFTETGLAPEILKAIDELGFINPTPIQEKTIPALLETKTDLVALAQTGTGKTAAFGLPILQLTDTKKQGIQTIVLCPTRELCLQITKDMGNYSKYIKDFKVTPVYGGANIIGQIKDLKAGTNMVIGTPGRVVDLVKRKALLLGKVNWLVLDEADEMLNMGFKDDLDFILSHIPAERQTLLFSATMPKEIEQIARNYMVNPETIAIGNRNEGAENVSHEYFVVHARDRYETLKRIADINPKIYGIVFCRTRQETKEVADKLMQDGYNADALHGDLSQAQRDHVMGRFRLKHLQILVATDVAARGLDVNDLTHVINYNLPDDLEVYVHRSGRTGRAGKSGISITIIHTRETGRIRELERMARKKFTRGKVPTGKDICEKQLFNLIDKVENIEVDNHQIEQFLPEIYKKLEWLERNELIKHFVSVEFNHFLNYYKNARDLNVEVKEARDSYDSRDSRGSRDSYNSRDSRSSRDSRDSRDSRSSRSESRGDSRDRSGSGRSGRVQFTRFHINAGSKHNLTATQLIGLINSSNPKHKIEIGKIDLLRNFSFFEADTRFEQQIMQSLQNTSLNDVDVAISISKPEKTFERREWNSNESGDRDKRKRKQRSRA